MAVEFKAADTSQRAIRSHVACRDFIVSCALSGLRDAKVIQHLSDVVKESSWAHAIVPIAEKSHWYRTDSNIDRILSLESQSAFLRGTQLIEEYNVLPTSSWVYYDPFGAFGEVVSARARLKDPSPSDIFANLRKMGLGSVAERLHLLKKMADEDANEPSMHIKSLQSLEQFLIAERWLKQPRIGLSPDGLLQIEWLLEDGGLLAIWFLADGRVQFVATQGETGANTNKDRVSGVFGKDDMLRAVLPFTKELIRQ